MRLARLILALMLTAGLMLVGLGSIGPKASAQQGGKVIRFGVNRAAENLDPVTQDANPDIWAFMQIYQQLVRVNVKGDGFEPDLAEKWTTSADGRTWTFFLRKNAKFSNGDTVKAADAVWSLKRARDTKGPWKWALEAVEDIQAKDDFTVVISLKEPWAPFLADISLFSNSIMPEKVFKGAKDEDISNKPVGSGPWMLADWKKGEELVMKPNPHYYEKGLPKASELRIRYIPDDNSRIIALQSGDVDGIDYPPFSRIEELKKDSKLEAQLNPSTQVSHLSLNMREAPLNNVKFRQALAFATDRAAIVKAVCFGHCTPATTFLPMTTPVLQQGLEGQRVRPQQGQAAPQGIRHRHADHAQGSLPRQRRGAPADRSRPEGDVGQDRRHPGAGSARPRHRDPALPRQPVPGLHHELDERHSRSVPARGLRARLHRERVVSQRVQVGGDGRAPGEGDARDQPVTSGGRSTTRSRSWR